MADSPLLLYLQEFQNYNGTLTLIMHTSASSAGLLPAVRSVVASLDANLPVFAVKTMSEQVGDSLWQPRMAAGILGSFSFLALVLAAVGLYAVVAQSMVQRTREIGIRMALGANPRDVMRLAFGYGTALAFWGIVTGIFLASGAARMVSAQLFGAGSTDVVTMALIVVLLLLVMLAACYIPARRAIRMDPMVALRYE
jgi:putative ABC transport system permease protein